MRVSIVALAALLGLSLSMVAEAAVIVSDFSGGVAAVNHPNPADGGANAFSVWYDITNDAFATPSASTLAGSPAMRIDDGGFTNGVYAIYQSVVPTTGLYTLSADILVNDTATSGMSKYQVGVIVNGVHRGPNPSDVATFSGPGTAVGNYTGLTSGALDATTIQTVTTGIFPAVAGDNLLIGFSTDLDTGDFDSNAGAWNAAFVQVDNIMLNVIPEPTSLVLSVLGLGAIGLFNTRRHTGR